MPRLTVTRRLTFNAAHRIHNPALSDDENARLFGPCNWPNWHGHNYTLEVTVAGEPDAVTGFVVDLKWLKDVMEKEVVGVYDHRHLNLEVPEFARVIPTTENIAVAAWRRLEPVLNHAGGVRLSRVRVYETADIFAEYRGEP